MKNSVSGEKRKKMRDKLGQYEELKLMEQERQKNLNTYPQDTSRLSGRRAYVLKQLTIVLLIIVGIVIVYYLSH